MLPPLVPSHLTWRTTTPSSSRASCRARSATASPSPPSRHSSPSSLGVGAAYALARLPVPATRAILLGVVAGSAFPQIAIVSPLYLALRALGLRDTWRRLVLADVSFALPLVIWLLDRLHPRDSPRARQAAALDGAGRLAILRYVVLPLVAPGLASAALLTFLFALERVPLRVHLHRHGIEPDGAGRARAVPGRVRGAVGRHRRRVDPREPAPASSSSSRSSATSSAGSSRAPFASRRPRRSWAIRAKLGLDVTTRGKDQRHGGSGRIHRARHHGAAHGHQPGQGRREAHRPRREPGGARRGREARGRDGGRIGRRRGGRRGGGVHLPAHRRHRAPGLSRAGRHLEWRAIGARHVRLLHGEPGGDGGARRGPRPDGHHATWTRRCSAPSPRRCRARSSSSWAATRRSSTPSRPT